MTDDDAHSPQESFLRAVEHLTRALDKMTQRDEEMVGLLDGAYLFGLLSGLAAAGRDEIFAQVKKEASDMNLAAAVRFARDEWSGTAEVDTRVLRALEAESERRRTSRH